MRPVLALISGCAAMLLAACSTGPATSVVRAEWHSAPGLPPAIHQIAEAVRHDGRWRVTYRPLTGNRGVRRFVLSSTDGERLDQLLASNSLYVPQGASDDGCIDPPLRVLEVTDHGSTRRLVFQCDSAPDADIVFGLLGIG